MRLKLSVPSGLPRNDGFAPTGWAGVADDIPPWNLTLVASWTQPAMDRVTFWMRAVAAAVAMISTAGLVIFANPGAAALAFVFGAWMTWDAAQMWRARRPALPLELRLSPDHLRLASTAPNFAAFELARDEAEWLLCQAGTYMTWHVKYIALLTGEGRPVVDFVGALAKVRYEAAESPVTTPEPHRVPDQLPVSVLIGAWWPHPARRAEWINSTVSARIRWREPGIEGFPRTERNQRGQCSRY